MLQPQAVVRYNLRQNLQDADPSHLRVDGHELGLSLELQLPHPDKILVNFGQALLAPVL